MSEDRAEKLSEKRRSSREKVRDAASKKAESEDTNDVEDEEGEEEEDNQTLKDEREGKLFYLSPDQVKDVDHVYNQLKTAFEYEYEQSFLKNRHYYPLVVKHGLDHLEGLDAEKVHNLLEDIGALDG